MEIESAEVGGGGWISNYGNLGGILSFHLWINRIWGFGKKRHFLDKALSDGQNFRIYRHYE